MAGDLVVVSGHRETAVPKLISTVSQRFRLEPDVDDLRQTVQPGPFSEKQV